jgi:hypothetical protein
VTRRFERVIASYRIDGVSNRLERSQPEVFAIQNALPLFQRPEWLRKRIAIFARYSLSYSRRAASLSRRVGLSIWAGKLAGFFGRVVAYPIERLLAALRPPAQRPQALARLQMRVMHQRITNDALERRAEGMRGRLP